jgi:hypothetical protein
MAWGEMAFRCGVWVERRRELGKLDSGDEMNRFIEVLLDNACCAVLCHALCFGLLVLLSTF